MSFAKKFMFSLCLIGTVISVSATDQTVIDDADLFYFAQAQRALKDYDKAITAYQDYITNGKDLEKIWYSKYMIGLCYEIMNQWDNALQSYEEAYAFNPNRAEPLLRMATHYRHTGDNNLSYQYAKQGLSIPRPAENALFVCNPVYDYLLDQEMSVVAYYTPYKEDGFTAVKKLIQRNDIPAPTKELAERNSVFYTKCLNFGPISKETVQEDTTLFYKAKSQEEVSKIAMELYKKGYDLLQSTFEFDSLKLLYKNDENRLKSFPFSSYSVEVASGQGAFYLDQKNNPVKKELSRHFPWNPNHIELIKCFAKSGTLAIDIGAHIGTDTLKMSECVGNQGTVIAFEPSDKIFDELCMNLAINNCQNVRPMRCALGKAKDIINVVLSNPDNENEISMIKQKTVENSAYLTSLDDFQLNNISFIKIDVDDLDAVIDGAMQTIKRNQPTLLIKIQDNAKINQSEDQVEHIKNESMTKLEDLGYDLYPINEDHYLAFQAETA